MFLARFIVLFLSLNGASARAQEAELRPYQIEEDRIEMSLTGDPGDPVKGKALVLNRQTSLCVLCHSGPFPDARAEGNLGPNLIGIGKRLSLAQLRLRIVDGRQINPDTIMPSYYRIDQLQNVAPKFRDKPLLSASEIEDIIAYLAIL